MKPACRAERTWLVRSGRNIIRTASADEIQSLLPLGQKCPHSPRLTARGAGLILFLGVSLRLDSAKLLEGYVDDLAALLDDPDQGVRGGAIYILGATNPAPSPKALAHLEAHLNDQISDDNTASTLAASLLKARGASVIPAVLTLLGTAAWSADRRNSNVRTVPDHDRRGPEADPCRLSGFESGFSQGLCRCSGKPAHGRGEGL